MLLLLSTGGHGGSAIQFLSVNLFLFVKIFSQRKVSTGRCREAVEGQCLTIYNEQPSCEQTYHLCRLPHCGAQCPQPPPVDYPSPVWGQPQVSQCPNSVAHCPHQTVCGQHFWGPCVGRYSESNFCPNYRPFGPADWDQEVLNVNGAVVWAACPICPVSRFSRMEKSSRYFWPQTWDEEVSRDGVILSQVGPCVQMSGLVSGWLHSRIAERREWEF